MDVYLDTNTVSYSDEYPPHWTAPVLAKARERLKTKLAAFLGAD